MLLRDCPVGSVVRLVSLGCETDSDADYWKGSFVVLERDGVNCVKDGDGDIWNDIYDDEDYQFEIVSQPNTPNNHARQIVLDGVTYRLTPATERKTIEIDGVVYEMEAV